MTRELYKRDFGQLIIIDDPYSSNSCPIDLPERMSKIIETLKNRGIVISISQIVHDKDIEKREKEDMANVDMLQTISEDDPVVITYSLSNLAIKLDKRLKGQWHGDTEIGDKQIYLKFLGRDEQGRMRLGTEVR